MEVTPSRPPAIPPRRTSHDPPVPPVPSRWDLCTQHIGNKYTAICTTCVKFLCRDCLLAEIYFHQKCSIAYLDDNILEACHQLHGSLNTKLDVVCQTLTDFHRSLSKKKERMLKKRNETMSEINRYFNQLKDRLVTKLQEHEDDLIAVLNDKVNEQDAMISEKIQLCDKTLNKLEEKRAVIHNQARHSTRGGSPLALLKNLVTTVEDMQNTEKIRKDITAVRDAFLLIRFFVNSENEQSILNSDIACVEVLNSRTNSQNISSLESERINEVSYLQDRTDTPAVSETFTDNPRPVDSTRLMSNEVNDVIAVPVSESQSTSALRVNLPPRRAGNIQFENTREDVNVSDVNVENNIQTDEQNDVGTEPDHDDEHSDASGSFDHTTEEETDNDTADLRQLEELNHSDTVQEDNESLSNDPEILTASENELQGATPDDSSALSNRSGIDVVVTQSENNSNEERAESRASDRDQNDVTERSASSSPFPNRDDDPPPPYPGLPTSPVQPGPDELPPPYPGGPPPPYSQTPEAQQPSQNAQRRQRVNGESGRGPASNSGVVAVRRPISTDSELLSRLRDMPIMPPSQSHTPRLTRPKAGKTFTVNEANDRRVSGVFALAVVKDNAFLIVDRWNKKLKYFSSAGVSFGGLIFREEPWDITEITNDLVAVTVPQLNTLYKIKVAGNSVITTSTVSTPRMYACVSYSKNTEIFVCGQVPQFGEPVIDVIGINGGEILQTFRTQFNMDQIRLSYPRYVKVDDEGTVIVCDWNLKCLTVFRLDGSMVGIYRGTVEFPLNEPSGIAYNQHTKEIFVIDAKHNSTQGAVHKLSKDCVCREIIRFDNEFRIARAITAHGSSYALGNKSGVVSIFRRQRR